MKDAMAVLAWAKFGLQVFQFLLFFAPLSLVMMVFWNYEFVPLTNFLTINYWQALGICIMARLLLWRPAAAKG